MANSDHELQEYKLAEFNEVKALIREVLPEEPGRGNRKSKKVPANARPTMLFVCRDMSCALPVNRYDEVYPGIILGDYYLARKMEELKALGITHILNAAQGERFNQIDTNAAYYGDLEVEFMGIPAVDVAKFKLSQYFLPAAEFIHKAVQDKGRVFVHCHQGISRSASLILVYLMLYHKMALHAAITTVRKRRAIFPNDGFLKQLCTFHNEQFVSQLPGISKQDATEGAELCGRTEGPS